MLSSRCSWAMAQGVQKQARRQSSQPSPSRLYLSGLHGRAPQMRQQVHTGNLVEKPYIIRTSLTAGVAGSGTLGGTKQRPSLWPALAGMISSLLAGAGRCWPRACAFQVAATNCFVKEGRQLGQLHQQVAGTVSCRGPWCRTCGGRGHSLLPEEGPCAHVHDEAQATKGVEHVVAAAGAVARPPTANSLPGIRTRAYVRRWGGGG